MKTISRSILLLFALLATVACSSQLPFVKSVKQNMNLEHVYSRPSAAYGPGTIVYYTEKSGYSRACWAWELMELPKESYTGLLIKNPIAGGNIKSNSNISFNLDLDAKKLAKLKTNFKSVSEMKVVLKNGKQYDLELSIGKLFRALKREDNECRLSLKAIKSANPDAQLYMVLTTFAYDIDYSVKTDKGWVSSAKVSKELLKQINNEIQLSGGGDGGAEISGKQMFIGFTGLPAKVSNKQYSKISDSDSATSKGLASMLNDGGGNSNKKITSIDLTEALDLSK
ncbi:MAG: hypothetical protein H7A25_09715 [Leptospiraceae bacterium]|nr:hypothetical protein [Leptospiraceae bacterium]MCP5500167.1 hypothetical protein [Leptospiraceae bacterium]